MGVVNLWQAVKPAASEDNLADYCMRRAILQTEDVFRVDPLVVGIDASIWMHETQTVFFHRHHSQMGENPELRLLFYHLSNLLKMAIIPVFVFDGPGRPSVKRGKKVPALSHWMTERFEEFIDAFGFHAHMAPGEAEAELASLNKTDGSMWSLRRIVMHLFSGRVAPSDTEDAKKVIEVYDASTVRDSLSVSLTEGGLLLFALLCGGDYDNGIQGCGPKIAAGLARSGLGDVLLAATQMLHGNELVGFLHTWREDLCLELAKNKHGHLLCRQPILSTSIPESFPNIDVLLLYVRPLVSPLSAIRQLRAWTSRNIRMREMAVLCERTFLWGGALKTITKFINIVWDGVCFRQLLEFALRGYRDDAVVPLSMFGKARRLQHSLDLGLGNLTTNYNITVNISHLNRQLSLYLCQPPSLFEVTSLPGTVKMKIPGLLREHYLSDVFKKTRQYRSK